MKINIEITSERANTLEAFRRERMSQILYTSELEHKIGEQTYSLFPKAHEFCLSTYDTLMGAEAGHQVSKKYFPGPHHMEDEVVLRDGLKIVQVLPEDKAKQYQNLIIQDKAENCNDKEGFIFNSRLFNRDPDLAFALLEDCITDKINQALIGKFKSHFMPCLVGAWETNVGADLARSEVKDTSYYWHCDAAPKQYMKILFFLNDFAEHGGGTAFLKRPSSERFAEIGYVHGGLDARVEDLGELANSFNIPYEPLVVQPKPGQGVLFEPSKILHRGIKPSTGPRYAIQIGFVPSPQDWRTTFKAIYRQILQNTGSSFPVWTFN